MLTRRSVMILGAASGVAACGSSGEFQRRKSGPPLFEAAFLFGFPIFEFARTASAQAGATAARPQHRFNQFTHRAQLADHASRAVTTPNNDTIYSSARLDLSAGPATLIIPSVHDRYFSVAFMNAFTDNFAYVGTRATNGVGGRYVIAGPRWRGEAAPGAIVLRSKSDDVWALARFAVAGERDLAAAAEIQQALKIVDAAPPTFPSMAPATASDPEDFLSVVNAMLARIAAPALARMGVGEFAAVGLGAQALITPALLAAWSDALPGAMSRLAGGFAAEGAIANGWRYSDPHIGGARASAQVRASTALSGLAAMTRNESLYAACERDADGAPLGGSRAYRLSLPAAIPCGAFWSVSMYAPDTDGRLFFIENDARRYSIGDRTPGLVRRSDGGVDIIFSHAQPEGATSANWLPAPAGPFRLVFRAYLPGAPMLNGSWRLPPVSSVV